MMAVSIWRREASFQCAPIHKTTRQFFVSCNHHVHVHVFKWLYSPVAFWNSTNILPRPINHWACVTGQAGPAMPGLMQYNMQLLNESFVIHIKKSIIHVVAKKANRWHARWVCYTINEHYYYILRNFTNNLSTIRTVVYLLPFELYLKNRKKSHKITKI